LKEPAMNRLIASLLTALMTAGAMSTVSTVTAAPASKAGSVPMSRLVAAFTSFAGSTANAESLVQGLRTGSSITLVSATNTTTTFSPATKAMGWGNVKIALALAQAELTSAGITNPTPADIQAALNGGTVTGGTTTTTLTGVLTQRASGLGWGQIAHADNLNLGTVISGVSKPTAAGGAHASTTGIVTAGGGMSESNSHHGGSKAGGVVTAAGGQVIVANGHAAGALTASGETVTGAATTAAGSESGGSATHGHGKGHGG
jgi:hypothetical protein